MTESKVNSTMINKGIRVIAIVIALVGIQMALWTSVLSTLHAFWPPSVEMHCYRDPSADWPLIFIWPTAIIVVFMVPAVWLWKEPRLQNLLVLATYSAALSVAVEPIQANSNHFIRNFYYDKRLPLDEACLHWLLGKDKSVVTHRFGQPEVLTSNFEDSGILEYRAFRLFDRQKVLFVHIRKGKVAYIEMQKSAAGHTLTTTVGEPVSNSNGLFPTSPPQPTNQTSPHSH